MSMALKAARARQGRRGSGAFIGRARLQGDPGLFGFLGDVAKTAAGFIPGPVGTIARAGIDALSGGSSSGGGGANGNYFAQQRAALGQGGIIPGGLNPIPVTSPPITTTQQRPSTGASIAINPPFGGPPGIGFDLSTGFAQVPQAMPVASRNGGAPQVACPSGFHPNKSDYFLRDGTFVAKGSKCVKNRRTNPLNPRAASRSIRRLESAKKAVRRLDRISIKCKRCGRARCTC